MGFWQTYFAVGIVGAAFIWFGIPELHSPDEAAGGDDSAAVPITVGEKASSESPAPVRTLREAGTLLADIPELPAVDGNSSGIAWKAPEEMGSGLQETEPPPRPRGAEAGYDWGVLAESTPCYNSSGAVSGRLNGGVVVEKISSHDSSRGVMLRCRVLENQVWRNDVFIPEKAVVVFSGPYARAPEAERAEVIHFLALKAKIEDRRKSLKELAVKANPHFKDYQRVAKELLAVQADSKKLTAQRDEAAGPERSRIDDELRSMKFRAASVEREFSRVEKDYKRWKTGNDDGTDAIEADETLRSLGREYAELEPRMRDVIYGL